MINFLEKVKVEKFTKIFGLKLFVTESLAYSNCHSG